MRPSLFPCHTSIQATQSLPMGGGALRGSSSQSQLLFCPSFFSWHGPQGCPHPLRLCSLMWCVRVAAMSYLGGAVLSLPAPSPRPFLAPSASLALRSVHSTWMILNVDLRASSRSRGVWMGPGPLCLRTGSPPPGIQDGGGFCATEAISVCSQNGIERKGKGVQGLERAL